MDNLRILKLKCNKVYITHSRNRTSHILRHAAFCNKQKNVGQMLLSQSLSSGSLSNYIYMIKKRFIVV